MELNKKIYMVHGRKLKYLDIWEPDKELIAKKLEKQYRKEQRLSFVDELNENFEDFTIRDHYSQFDQKEENYVTHNTLKAKNNIGPLIIFGNIAWNYCGFAEVVLATDIEIFSSKEEAIKYIIYKNPNGNVNVETGVMYATPTNGNWEYYIKEKEIKQWKRQH